MLRLSRVPTPADVAVFVNGTAIPAGATGGALAPGQAGQFSVVATPGSADVTVLLPLGSGQQRQRTEIAVANTTTGGRATMVVDTPSAASLIRPEPSDHYFCTTPSGNYWGQLARIPLPRAGLGRRSHDVLVAGWLLSDSDHTQFRATDRSLSHIQSLPRATAAGRSKYCEDIHYFLLLDPSFIARTYNQPGIDTVLTGAHIPGVSFQVPAQADPAPLSIADTIGGATAITINSFGIQSTASCAFHTHPTNSVFDSLMCIKGEQPAWHVNTTPPTGSNCFCRHALGLGPPPPPGRPCRPIRRSTRTPHTPTAPSPVSSRSRAQTPRRRCGSATT